MNEYIINDHKNEMTEVEKNENIKINFARIVCRQRFIKDRWPKTSTTSVIIFD
jgi:hypothetical protein